MRPLGRRMASRAVVLGLAAVVAGLGAGCKKGGAPDAGARGRVVDGPSAAWLEGRLPASATGGTPRPGGTLTVRVGVEPAGLTMIHDQMAEGTTSRYLHGTVYETLAELDRNTHPEYALKPLLAESWHESDDHLTLTVKLRKGVRFHDGQPMTSKDVKASLEVVLDEKHLTTRLRSYFVDLESFEAPDPHTFVLHWKKPYFLAARNYLTSIPVMPAAKLQGDFDTLAVHRAPVGTGPFRFEAWETGRQLSMVRHEDYWGQKTWLDRVVIRFVKDETVAAQLWEQGEFDLMTRIQPAVWRALETPAPENAWAWTRYHRVRFAENVYSWVGWNEERPFFQDKRVRRALAMLFPWDTVTRNIDLGLELPTTCPYYAQSASCDPNVRPIPYDPKAAAALLDQAGWKDTNDDGVRDKDGVPFKFTFLSNPHSVKLGKLLPLMQEEFRKVGIDMGVERAEMQLYLRRLISHDFDVGSLAWGNSDPIKDNYQIFHSSQADGGSNYVSYNNPQVDRALEEIRTTFDPTERAAQERAVHRLLFDDQVYLFLTTRPALDALKVRVRGLHPSLGWYDLREAWVDDGPDAGSPAGP